MTGNAGTKAVKAHGRARDKDIARSKVIKALEAQWVNGTELTPAQLAQVQPSLKQAMYARNPGLAA